MVPSFHVCSKGEFSISPFKNSFGYCCYVFFKSFSPLSNRCCGEVVFGTREGGKPYKTQAVVFFCRFAKQLVSLATVFLSSRNASQFVGEEHCVTRRKRLQGRLEVGFIKVRSTLQVKP